MLDQPPKALLAYVAALVVVALLGARWLAQRDPAQPVPPPSSVEVHRQADGARVTVHVAGAVRRPGVYRLREGARVDDAVARAGGVTSRADLTQVNLAAEAEDGRQILVPERLAAASGASGASGGADHPVAGAVASAPINLNTATLEQLDQLDGIGPAMAQQILDYRAEHSGFGSVDELARVPGIGPKRMASLREQVRV